MIEIVKNSWKEFFRSAVWQKNAFVNFLMGLMFLYLALNFVFLGWAGGYILMGIFPGESPIENLNYGLLYYFLVDLFLRFYMQEIPVIGIVPYLHLPVKKKKIIHYLLAKSAFGVFNTSILTLAVPFAIAWIAKYESTSGAWYWLFAVFAFNLINNYLIVYLKKAFSEKPSIVLGFGGVIAALITLEYFGFIKIGTLSLAIFNGVIYNGLILLPIIFIAIAIYLFVYRYYANNAYLENLKSSKKKNVKSTNISFLDRFEQIGKLIEVEIKLILRNKRPKSVTVISFLFVAYGFILYPTTGTNAIALIIFGLIITGMFMLNYGQFLISWESAHFDGLLARNVQLKDYVRAKFYLFGVAVIISFILSLCYFMYGARVIAFNGAVALFNLGVTSWVVLFFSTFNPKKIDLSKSTFFNYQGTSSQQFLLMVPVMGLPILIYGLGYLVFGLNETAGAITLAVFGLIGVISTKPLTNILAKRLKDQKYKIASNFRE